MKIHTMEQRTKAWDDIRKAKITASVAEKMITPGGKVSTQAKPFIGTLIAEQMGLQEPDRVPPTYWVERGIELEPEANGWFQVETGLHVTKCGFIESDDGLAGFSPDGYLLEDGLGDYMTVQEDGSVIISSGTIIPVEYKVPKPSTHIGYLLEKCVPKQYLAQCHFAMVITGAPYMWFMSYNPGLPALLLKVERGDYTLQVETALELFKQDLVEARKLIGVST